MGSEETKVYIALLIAGFIFFTVVITFLLTIISYQKKSVSAYLDRMKADLQLSEEERARWAYDIHDELGSKLSAVKLMTDDFPATDIAGKASLHKISDSLGNLMQSVRQISNSLVPYALEREGLLVSLEELVSTVFSDSSIQVSLTWNIAEDCIPDDFKIHIYRIIQELLSNAIKHADAGHISLSANFLNSNIQIIITDDGIGFDRKQVQKSAQGLGLRNLMARVNIMKGDVYLNTSLNKGTSYLIELPVH